MNDATGAQTVRALRAVDAALPAIPERVLWDESNHVFRDEAGNESGEAFSITWHPRAAEFPRWEDKVAENDPGTPTKADPRPLEEIGRDENDKVHNAIASDHDRQHALLARLDAEINAEHESLMDMGDESARLRTKIDLGMAKIAELERQRHEALDRIELLGGMLLDTKMKQLRRVHS